METQPVPALLPAPSPSQGGDTASTPAASADFDSFLRLLTAQLRYQDPLQPLDSTQFVAQLASFSTVEQLVGVNERLDALASDGEGAAAAALSGWIGTRVSTVDGSFRSTGEPIELEVSAVPSASFAVASILDTGGAVLQTFPANPSGGLARWDGRDQNGREVPPTDLKVRVDYFAGEELVESRPAMVFRTVVGLSGGTAGPRLDLADGGSADPALVAALRGSAERIE